MSDSSPGRSFTQEERARAQQILAQVDSRALSQQEALAALVQLGVHPAEAADMVRTASGELFPCERDDVC